MGKTISAYADDVLAKAVDAIVAEEGRPQAQVAANALALFAALPAGGRRVWEYLRQHATEEELGRIALQVARQLVAAQHDVVMRVAFQGMTAEDRAAIADALEPLANGTGPMITNAEAERIERERVVPRRKASRRALGQ